MAALSGHRPYEATALTSEPVTFVMFGSDGARAENFGTCQFGDQPQLN